MAAYPLPLFVKYFMHKAYWPALWHVNLKKKRHREDQYLWKSMVQVFNDGDLEIV